ncbi:FAS1 domain-containing protein [Amylostereum chailletii]|nr:FAS1 domain-containing protein [Amylostereum chailletii]
MLTFLVTLPFFALPAFASALAHQAAFHSPPSTASLTLVDALSGDPDYTSLLRLLQRAKLIPTLNKLNGSTLFAPTNDAIHRHASINPLWHQALRDDPPLLDNVNERLRQDLFYHILNYNISLPEDDHVIVTKTLHYPSKPIQPPTHDPPPRPPWLPIPGGTLGGEPQRLRLALKDGDVRVGVDTFGAGGAKLVKEVVSVRNGILLGIDDVLQVPSHLAHVVAHQSSISYFQRIVSPDVADRLANSSELTLFVPVDSAFDALPDYERLYLESEFAADDLQLIYEMHAVAQKQVYWSESFNPGVNLTTIHGQTLDIVSTPDKVLVSGADMVQPDIYASNGVLHTVSSLLLPPGALQLTPEKLLLTFNCTNFISMLHSVDLTYLVNDTDTQYTILAPQDDALSLYGDDDLPKKGTAELSRMLQYHFLPGRWTAKRLKGANMLETELKEIGLDGGRQVLQAEVTEKAGDKSASIRFGGASVVGEPLEINNTIIYFISRPLLPPSDPIEVAFPSIDLSTFLAAIYTADLADLLKTAHRTTLLVPHNDAFKRLGMLVSAHLLAPSSKADLRHVILHHVLKGVEYASDLHNGSARNYGTLDGSDVHIERATNGSLILNASGGWAGLNSELTTVNMLSSTGVVHELSDVLIPRTVELTVGKLVKAASGTTMATLVTKAGMDWILNGTKPPSDSPWGRDNVIGTGWTLLCPTDDAFKQIDLTELYADQRQLRATVAQHLVKVPSPPPKDSDAPNNNRPLALVDKEGYKTLRSPDTEYGDIVFRSAEDGSLVVGIKEARGTGARADWAHVLEWGRATTGGGSGGVVKIDRLLMPYSPPWWIAYGPPIVVGLLGLALISGFFWIVRMVWRRDATEATYEPVGGFEQESDGDA